MKIPVTCLEAQSGLFETRLLRRVADPAFINPSGLPGEFISPLVLYGEWHPEGFWQGLRWLSPFVFRLPRPCILMPPFREGNLDPVLGLSTQLIVRSANLNQLAILPDGRVFGLEKQVLRIQTDFVFEGPAGKHLVKVTSGASAVVIVQPKNTSTPLLLCGSRLLSPSALSDDEDRIYLINALLGWATNWQPTKIEPVGAVKSKEILDESQWNTICTIIAGTGTTDAREIISLAYTILGVDLHEAQIQQATDRLQSLGMADTGEEGLRLNMEALEQYIQAHDLWAYVRTLRKEFGKELLT